ncbi:hypothetical protein HDU83_007098 [Entophlyctis luteolus]|nr:hypothetical protein HDU83_007098 [Entophlyctis luteolus]
MTFTVAPKVFTGVNDDEYAGGTPKSIHSFDDKFKNVRWGFDNKVVVSPPKQKTPPIGFRDEDHGEHETPYNTCGVTLLETAVYSVQADVEMLKVLAESAVIPPIQYMIEVDESIEQHWKVTGGGTKELSAGLFTIARKVTGTQLYVAPVVGSMYSTAKPLHGCEQM